MNVKVKKRFEDDLNRTESMAVIDAVEFVFQLATTIRCVEDIPGFKWLTGYPGLGRISIGDHRIGVGVHAETIIFCRVLHRAVIYSEFP